MRQAPCSDLDLFLRAHPNVTDHDETRREWARSIARGENPARMVAAAETYAEALSRRQTVTHIVPAHLFIAPDGPWRDWT